MRQIGNAKTANRKPPRIFLYLRYAIEMNVLHTFIIIIDVSFGRAWLTFDLWLVWINPYICFKRLITVSITVER